jgi:hypothetical protein
MTPKDPNTPWTVVEGTGKIVPGLNRPYIMFAQKPYNAFYFGVVAKFDSTITNTHPDYTTAVGLVGMATDGDNYWLGRYCFNSENLEIVKVKDGKETVCATYNYPDIPHDFYMYFRQDGGTFKLGVDSHMLESYQLEYVPQNHSFIEKDNIPLKTGIYGLRSMPSAKITGFFTQESEIEDYQYSNTEGIAVLPGESIVDFASSGSLQMGDDIYAYDWKSPLSGVTGFTDPNDYARGPFQLRNESEDYGSGQAGCEVRDHDWSITNPEFGRYAILALDSGSTFVCSGSVYRVVRDTERPGRARWLTGNKLIGHKNDTLATKVWLTQGFSGLTLIKGALNRHHEGDIVQQYQGGELYCKWFAGASGSIDYNVQELVDRTCKMCGAVARFSSDFYDSATHVLNQFQTFQTPTLQMSDGIDLRFKADFTSGSGRLLIHFNAKALIPEGGQQFNTCDRNHKSWFYSSGSGTEYAGLRIEFELQGNDMLIIDLVTDGDNAILASCHLPITIRQLYSGLIYPRIVFQNNCINVYVNERWATTFYCNQISYGTQNTVWFQNYGAIPVSLSRVYLLDLSDWREAIYIDLETDGLSALSSIIQERPIDMFCRSDGAIDFVYEPARTIFDYSLDPLSVEKADSYPIDAGSDLITYGMVAFSMQSYEYAMKFGFSTKVMRVPNLETGAARAVRKLSRMAVERSTITTLTMRPDIRLELGDKLRFQTTVSGTGTHFHEMFIVEEISVQTKPPSFMVRGRLDWADWLAHNFG